MMPSDFRDFFVNGSSQEQQDIVSTLLSLSLQASEVKDSNEIKSVTCPHCSNKRIRFNGKLKGVQRYLCKCCKKNFSETTGKFRYNIKKEDKLNRYLYCLLSGYSIRKRAKEAVLSIQTSFDWRHKLLISFSSVSLAEFQGILESDDLFFSFSEKGNRHLDRKPKKRVEKASKAGISKEKVAEIAPCDRVCE